METGLTPRGRIRPSRSKTAPVSTDEVIRIARMVAGKYALKQWVRLMGVEREDLQQVACEAIIRRVGDWDPDKGNSLPKWMYWIGAGAVRHYLRDHGSVLYIPRRTFYDKSVTMPVVMSLSSPVGGRDPDLDKSLGETISNSRASDPEIAAIMADAFRRLLDKERKVLFLACYVGLPQSKISKIIGVSQKHVSRLFVDARTKMMEAMLS